jgi:hypothetical protein
MPLVLSADGSGVLKWWVDASFAVHPNLRGHSDVGLSMGRGFPITCSTKQKINTCSSTESELVGADDFMPAICWTRYFLAAQGYHVRDNIIFQDNKSAIFWRKMADLPAAGEQSISTFAISFICDRVSHGESTLEWCSTTEMVGDFMTKPLQGASFRKFRDIIMGVVSTADTTTPRNTSLGLVPQERGPTGVYWTYERYKALNLVQVELNLDCRSFSIPASTKESFGKLTSIN